MCSLEGKYGKKSKSYIFMIHCFYRNKLIEGGDVWAQLIEMIAITYGLIVLGWPIPDDVKVELIMFSLPYSYGFMHDIFIVSNFKWIVENLISRLEAEDEERKKQKRFNVNLV